MEQKEKKSVFTEGFHHNVVHTANKRSFAYRPQSVTVPETLHKFFNISISGLITITIIISCSSSISIIIKELQIV